MSALENPALPLFLRNYTANQAHMKNTFFLWLSFSFALAKFML